MKWAQLDDSAIIGSGNFFLLHKSNYDKSQDFLFNALH